MSRPAFDPNEFAIGIDPVRWRSLNTDPLTPLVNRALQGQYPPGSTYKVVTAIGGLEEKLIGEHSDANCAGSFRLGRRTYRCWKKDGHGIVDLHTAIVQSCDVFFYKVGLDLGVNRLAYYARALGLGSRTGHRPLGRDGRASCRPRSGRSAATARPGSRATPSRCRSGRA